MDGSRKEKSRMVKEDGPTMKIPKDIAERVVTGSMHELWDTFINLEGEYEEFAEDYSEVRFGIKVSFEIYELWEDTKTIMKKNKDGMVIINGNTYKVEEFRTEKEERRKIMVEAILNNVANVEVTTAR